MPRRISSVSWSPISAICPLFITTICCALRTVDRRCAMTTTALLPWDSSMMPSSVACTSVSLSASSALVASSSNRKRGLRMSARARQMRCSCPPLMWLSDSEPITVSKPPGRGSTKDVTSARSAAFLTSSSVASGRPILMLAATEPFKMAVSCITTPIQLLAHLLRGDVGQRVAVETHKSRAPLLLASDEGHQRGLTGAAAANHAGILPHRDHRQHALEHQVLAARVGELDVLVLHLAPQRRKLGARLGIIVAAILGRVPRHLIQALQRGAEVEHLDETVRHLAHLVVEVLHQQHDNGHIGQGARRIDTAHGVFKIGDLASVWCLLYPPYKDHPHPTPESATSSAHDVNESL
mmetsp:Transcript_33987/g.85609  ORF Transcript_33987/g.85609 Transcript_33987/m.85609 type:complete len:352 (-) Transcript_33987:698-1753(-)